MATEVTLAGTLDKHIALKSRLTKEKDCHHAVQDDPVVDKPRPRPSEYRLHDRNGDHALSSQGRVAIERIHHGQITANLRADG